MAESFNTFATLNGNFKEAYGDTVEKLYPETAWIMRNTKMKPVSGANYNQPVIVSFEQGATYSRANNGAFALEESVNSIMQNAQVVPAQIVMKATVAYEAAFRSEGDGKRAFMDATRLTVANVVDSATKRAEISMLYGQTGMGTVNAATVASTSFVISESSWASAIWAGLETAKIGIWDPAFAAAEDADETISTIDLDTRTVTVGNAQTLDAGDLVAFKGEVEVGPIFNSQIGLDKIATTATGTLFNINVGTFSLFRGQTVSAVGQITMAKIMNGVTKAVNRGCNEELAVLMNPRAYEVLNTDLAAFRRYDSSYSKPKATNGTESIEFYGANGVTKIVPHVYVKEGDAFIVPIKRLIRIGSTELTFKRPIHGDIFKEVAGFAGFELRAYLGQQIFCERPAWLVKLSGLTYP